MPERFTGEDRCWPCTLANAFVGFLVAWVPFGAAVVDGSQSAILGVGIWAVGMTGFTVYRLAARGYLPTAEPIAKLVGLHERIGPGRNHEHKKDR